MGMNAVCLSLLICAAPCRLNGSTVAATYGSFLTRRYDSSIACFCDGSVTLPARVWKTSGLLPFCCGGKRAVSRSVAAWLSVPGNFRLLLVLLPKLREAATSTTRRTTHAARTTHFLRAANI